MGHFPPPNKKKGGLTVIFDVSNRPRTLSIFLALITAHAVNPHMDYVLTDFHAIAANHLHASSSIASKRKLTGRKPSLQEIIAERGFFIQPS